MKPRPNFLPDLPEGAVYIGHGRPLGLAFRRTFQGWVWSPHWRAGWREATCRGNQPSLHYAATPEVAQSLGITKK